MSLKNHVFTPDFTLFLERLASFSHYQSFGGWQLAQAKKTIERSLDVVEKQGHKNQYGTGTGMSLFNIFHDGQLPIRAPFGKRVTQGEELLPMAEEMERRFNALILVSVFETLEVYLKALYGKLLYQLRNESGRNKTEERKFLKAKPASAKHKGTEPYFSDLAQFSCGRDCQVALDEFKKQLDWNRAIRMCDIGLDFFDMVQVIGFCRHRIIHREGRVLARSLGTLNKRQREFVTFCMHASLHAKERILLPPTEIMSKVYEAVASYGWGLYVLIAHHCSMEDESEFFRPEGVGKRKVKPR